MVTVVSKAAQRRVITVENRVQPPSVNELAIRDVPRVCQMLAGAEIQKGYTGVQPCSYRISNQPFDDECR